MFLSMKEKWISVVLWPPFLVKTNWTHIAGTTAGCGGSPYVGGFLLTVQQVPGHCITELIRYGHKEHPNHLRLCICAISTDYAVQIRWLSTEREIYFRFLARVLSCKERDQIFPVRTRLIVIIFDVFCSQ